MNRLSDPELWEYIRGDLPYFDLTTHLLALPPQEGTLRILTREAVTAACTEEAARIGELLGCEAVAYCPSGSAAAAALPEGQYATASQPSSSPMRAASSVQAAVTASRVRMRSVPSCGGSASRWVVRSK